MQSHQKLCIFQSAGADVRLAGLRASGFLSLLALAVSPAFSVCRSDDSAVVCSSVRELENLLLYCSFCFGRVPLPFLVCLAVGVRADLLQEFAGILCVAESSPSLQPCVRVGGFLPLMYSSFIINVINASSLFV